MVIIQWWLQVDFFLMFSSLVLTISLRPKWTPILFYSKNKIKEMQVEQDTNNEEQLDTNVI